MLGVDFLENGAYYAHTYHYLAHTQRPLGYGNM